MDRSSIRGRDGTRHDRRTSDTSPRAVPHVRSTARTGLTLPATRPTETERSFATTRDLFGGRFVRIAIVSSLTIATTLATCVGCTSEIEAPPIARPAPDRALDPTLRRALEPKLAAVTAAPRDANAHGLLAMVYEANEVWDLAALAYESAAHLDPTTPEWPFHAILCRTETGGSDRVLPDLTAFVERFPQFAPAHHTLGRIHLEAGEIDAAGRAFERARTLRPTAPEPLIALAQLSLLDGEPAASLARAEGALALAPDSPHARYTRGQALRALGRLDEAEPDLVAGVGGPPGRPRDAIDVRIPRLAVGISTLVDRAADLIDAGRAEEAIRHLRAALADHPDHTALRTNLAVALQRTGKLSEARTVLESLLAESPGDLAILLNLSEVLWQLRDHRRGLEIAEQVTAAHPEHGLARYAQGRALYAVGRAEEGLAACLLAAEAEPRNAMIQAGVAEGYVTQRKVAEAAESFARAAELDPRNLAYRANHCAMLLHLRRLAEAESVLEQLEVVAPADPRVIKLREQLVAAGGG